VLDFKAVVYSKVYESENWWYYESNPKTCIRNDK
jgi:hypothetical protein